MRLVWQKKEAWYKVQLKLQTQMYCFPTSLQPKVSLDETSGDEFS